MDIVYIFKHSPNQDLEIRHSLRSVERHAPYVRKVWIFGDRPAFISDDTSLIEHVAHEQITRAVPEMRLPVVNHFMSIVLSSMIPALSFEYLLFSDDLFLLHDYPIEIARKDRYLEDLTPNLPLPRGRSLWQDSLWRTRDLLVRLGHTAFNFEGHVPVFLTRKRVVEAYRDFHDFVTQDRFFGMLGISAVLNHALKEEAIDAAKPELISIKIEGLRSGFWNQPPLSHEALLREVEGKAFFNFNNQSFSPLIAGFLQDRFPNLSRFEKA